jgi:stage II sporulation protein B
MHGEGSQLDEQKSRTIKIILDGKDSEKKKNTSAHRWNSSQKETAAAIEKNSGEENESFSWVLPEEDVPKVGKDQGLHKIEYVSTSKGKKKSGKTLSGGKRVASLVLSIVSAMIVGIVLGFVIVKVVTNTDGVTPVRQAHSSQQGTVPTQSNEDTVVLPELSAPIVQGGIFSKEEAAQEVLKKVKEKGVPAEEFVQDGQYILLLGTAGSIEGAKKLGSLWKEKKVDVYAKNITIPERKIKVAKSDIGLQDQYVSLFQLLSTESANIVLNKEVDLANRDVIQSDLQKLEKQTPKTAALKTMQQLLLESGKAIIHVSKQADRQKGLDAQKHLLKFIDVYSSAK